MSRKTILAAALAALLAAPLAAQADLNVTSPDVAEGQQMPRAQEFNGFGCSGGNIAPAISWSGAPAGTRSFAVTVYDPDAPTGSGWWHWIVYDIPAGTTSLARGTVAATLPVGAQQGHNDYGTLDFGGACPPKGDKPHRYVFTVWALKVDKLGVPATASAALIGYSVRANTLASGALTARYGR